MIIYDQKNISFHYFAHIPRTAGRYVTANLKQNKNYHFFYDNFSHTYHGIDAPHLNAELYKEIIRPEYPVFFTVRNPYTRFVSIIRTMSRDNSEFCQISEFDINQLIQFINDYQLECKNNFFCPQVNYLRENSFFWKYENGFGKEYWSWLYNKTGLSPGTKSISYEKAFYDYSAYDIKKLERLKPIIQTLYQEDYETFDYPIEG